MKVRCQANAQKSNGKTKICICTDLCLSESYHGGVDRILNLARNVSKHGVDVYLVDRSKKSLSSLFLDDEKYYQIKDGVTRERHYPLHIKLIFPGLIKVAQEVFNRMASLLTFSTSTVVGGLPYTVDPLLFAKSYFVCKKERIDLIQCEFPITVPSAFVVKKLLNIPLVYDSHNVETEIIGSMPNISSTFVAMSRLIENASCVLCDSIFVVSGRDKEQLVSRGIPERKIEVIPNSVDVNRLSTALDGSEIRNRNRLNDKTVIIFHGTLGFPPNEEAARILANNVLPCILKKHPDVHLLLVGRNPPEISHPNIITTGFVKNLPEHIAAADIAAVPLLKGGGTRIKILEYMACGKPVVSTTKGAEGLDLQNGKDILVTKRPDSKFTDLVLKLIEDSALRRKIGTNARKRIELFYDWEVTAERAVRSYGKLITARLA